MRGNFFDCQAVRCVFWRHRYCDMALRRVICIDAGMKIGAGAVNKIKNGIDGVSTF